MRALLVVLLVCIAAPASAIRFNEKSRCGPRQEVLPERGAVNVPTNTLLWIVNGTRTTSRAIQGLVPHQLYDGPDAPAGFYTTGAGPDIEPPATPRIGIVAVTVTGGSLFHRGYLADLRVSGSFDDDTALLRLRFLDRHGIATYYTKPTERSVCNPELLLTTGPLVVEIVAIDLAGNESPPAVVVATSVLDDTPPSDNPPAPHGPSARLLVFAGLGLLLSIALAGAAIVRATKRDAAAVVTVPLAGAEVLARSVRLRCAIIVVATMVMAATLVRGELLFPCVMLAPSLGWLVLVSAARWWVAGTALGLLRRDDAHVTVRHDQLEVMAGDERATLCAPVRLVCRAMQQVIPQATI